MMNRLEQLRGNEVIVHYNGTLYRGTLMGATDTEIYLKTTAEWLTLPMDGITEVRAA